MTIFDGMKIGFGFYISSIAAKVIVKSVLRLTMDKCEDFRNYVKKNDPNLYKEVYY